jgi:hypothetical protein
MREAVHANLRPLVGRHPAAVRTTLMAMWGTVAGMHWWWSMANLEDL